MNRAFITTTLFVASAVATGSCDAQRPSLPPDPHDLVDAEQIPRYTARRTSDTVTVDGLLDESCWAQAERTGRFVDLISGVQTIHDTKSAILWDDDFLYVGFWLQDPLVTAKFKRRDAPIYNDNDVEIFIAGKDAYYEFEINAHGTIYEAFFIWSEAYERDGYDTVPGFRRSDPRVQSFRGVGFRHHPRGDRVACLAWDMPQLESAVHIDGTLNDNSDRDRGWTVELAIPWQSMKWLAKGDGRSLPPKDNDVWRIDLFRFNQYREAAPAKDSSGWAVGKHGVWDSHVPEIFPFVTFSASN